MSTERNKELVRTYLERVVSGGELALADSLLDRELVFTSPYTPEPIQGLEGFKAMIAGLRAAFPDLRIEELETIGEGDVVASRWLASATLEQLAAGAASGSRTELEELLSRIRDDVYGLAIRMLADPHDAEDATQEILVRVATHLGRFRGESSLRTWILRIASNHLVSTRRGRREQLALTFEAFGAMLDAGLAHAAAPPVNVDEELLEQEVKLGCTHAMLTCLGPEERLAFVLDEVLGLSGEEGAEVAGVDPAAFRKRVSRARGRMRSFLEASCGLVADSAACRCRKQVGPSLAAGRVDRERLVYAVHPAEGERDPVLWRAYRAIEEADAAGAVFRSHPRYQAPDALGRLADGLTVP